MRFVSRPAVLTILLTLAFLACRSDAPIQPDQATNSPAVQTQNASQLASPTVSQTTAVTNQRDTPWFAQPGPTAASALAPWQLTASSHAVPPTVITRPASPPEQHQAPTQTMTEPESQFAAQRTRLAPTSDAMRRTAPTLAYVISRHGQWALGGTSQPAEIRQEFGIAGSRSVKNQDQQYTCAFYTNGTEAARANLSMDRPIKHTVHTNKFGELQGLVTATTTINDKLIPVQWTTWTSRTDRLRLRGEGALLLVEAIRHHNATSFNLELHADPDLSRSYNVTDLPEALSANTMDCFERR